MPRGVASATEPSARCTSCILEALKKFGSSPAALARNLRVSSARIRQLAKEGFAPRRPRACALHENSRSL
jgi:hypothetical protein